LKDLITRLQLSNGLLVLLKEIHASPIISHWVWYRVGSKDEPTGLTGISHWTEHMQFKGTPTFPSGVLDRAISRDGGSWNAFTFLDWTTYFETMPAGKINLALELEADRMANSTFDEQDVLSERTVIISERQGSENEPLFKLGEEVQAAAFRVHPYHHEIIGDMADLKTIQRDDLFRHYHTFYTSNNAVLALAGDFETQAMMSRIEALYGSLAPGPIPSRLCRPEPIQNGERQVTVHGPGETTYIDIAFHAPAAADPDFFALSVLDSLLCGASNLNLFGGGISNKTSHLYRLLVEGELAVSVSGNLQATIDPYLYSISVILRPGRTPEEVIRTVEEEISRLQEKPVQPEELTRAVKQARAIFAYGSESITNQSFWLGFSEMFASYEWFTTYLDKLAAVSPLDVQLAAQKYLQPQKRVLGIYLPDGNKAQFDVAIEEEN
jgi:zinc protease